MAELKFIRMKVGSDGCVSIRQRGAIRNRGVLTDERPKAKRKAILLDVPGAYGLERVLDLARAAYYEQRAATARETGERVLERDACERAAQTYRKMAETYEYGEIIPRERVELSLAAVRMIEGASYSWRSGISEAKESYRNAAIFSQQIEGYDPLRTLGYWYRAFKAATLAESTDMATALNELMRFVERKRREGVFRELVEAGVENRCIHRLKEQIDGIKAEMEGEKKARSPFKVPDGVERKFLERVQRIYDIIAYMRPDAPQLAGREAVDRRIAVLAEKERRAREIWERSGQAQEGRAG